MASALSASLEGVWGRAPVGSRGKAPGGGSGGQSPPEADDIFLQKCAILAIGDIILLHVYVVIKEFKPGIFLTSRITSLQCFISCKVELFLISF
jgi:hypothetical protein